MTTAASPASARYPLAARLPEEGEFLTPDALLDRFLDYVKEKGVTLYPAQEEAILALFDDQNLILNTPTGSGKSLVATALHFKSLASGRVSYYTCPIKALVNEKFLALCQEFGPEHVGLVTGDGSVNPKATIICCTAEILANKALREGLSTEVDHVIMDEFHYYSDRDRGVAWQVPLLTLPHCRFLLMSATLGDTSFFESELTRLTGQQTSTIRSSERPVPLSFTYSETALHEVLFDLVRDGKAPVYVVHFTQREAAEEAQNLLSVDLCSKDEKKKIAEALVGARFSSPYGKEVQKLLRHGIGLHHAGLLPKYRILVERLAQQGLLKVICGTDTLGVGVNIPIRTVLFTKLCKFDGEKSSILSVRDFQQISGRAGRKGFDTQGYVVVQAPEHVIENLRMEQKAASDPKKAKKLVKKKPPEKGYVAWNEETFKKLCTAPPEALQSRFGVSHGMLLNVLSRKDDGCQAMRELIATSHEHTGSKRRLRRQAFQMFRGLLDRKLIELAPRGDGGPGKKIQIHVDLQREFSLNQTLALFLIDTLKEFDPESETYALDVLTLAEAIVENPELVLRKQADRLRNEKFHELKAAGVEYEERQAELEKITYPKPNADFLYQAFDQFTANHPWALREGIRPKSVAREMYEYYLSFIEYIREYDLQRSEGLLLRYLSEVFKVLVQTVPETARNEELEIIIEYFGTLIRSVDSSLLDEWEKMRDPNWRSQEADEALLAEDLLRRPVDITADRRRFTVSVRNEVHGFVRALASGDYESAAQMVSGVRGPGEDLDGAPAASGAEPAPWTPDSFKAMLEAFYTNHARITTDRAARSPANMRIDETADAWQIEQILVDPEAFNDWSVRLVVDLEKSREAGKPVLSLLGIGEIGALGAQ